MHTSSTDARFSRVFCSLRSFLLPFSAAKPALSARIVFTTDDARNGKMPHAFGHIDRLHETEREPRRPAWSKWWRANRFSGQTGGRLKLLGRRFPRKQMFRWRCVRRTNRPGGSDIATQDTPSMRHFRADRSGTGCHHFDYAFRCQIPRSANCRFRPRS